MAMLIDIPYWKDILVRSSQEALQLRQHIQPQPLPLLHICSDALSANNIKPIYRIHFLLLQAGFALTQGCAGKWSTAAQFSQMYMTSLHAQKSPFHLPACRQKRVDADLSGIQSVSPSTSPEVTFLGGSEGQWLHITSKIWLLFLTVSSQAFCACISAQELEKTMEEKRLLRPCETSGPCTKNNLHLH